jgi:putative membrane protein
MTVLSSLNPAEFPTGYSAKFGLLVNGLVGFLGAALALTLFLGRG